jgi:hypothetical protein
MARHLIQTHEAEWEGAERFWASVQQFNPRRGSLRGHLITILIAAALAALVVAIEGIVQ